MAKPSRVPGPLCNSRDFASQYHLLEADYFVQRTPGAWGVNDQSQPQYHLLDNAALSVSKPLNWDPDPHSLLLNSRVKPEFGAAAKHAVEAAVYMGIRVRITEVYRSPERSAALYASFVAAQKVVADAQAKLKKIDGEIQAAKTPDDKVKAQKARPAAESELKEARKHVIRAAPAWQSAHNFGLAMDVLCFSVGRKGKLVALPGSDKTYEKFAGCAAMYGIMWPALGGDRGHFEFHPKWAKPATGKLLTDVHHWAMEAVNWNLAKEIIDPFLPGVLQTGAGSAAFDAKVGAPKAHITQEQVDFDVLKYCWWAAGAGEDPPPKEFLAGHPVPTQ